MSSVKEYYRKKESRWGYKYLLKGNRHLGMGKGSLYETTINTVDRVANEFGGNNNTSQLLDAGCGEGFSANRISEQLDARVDGIDLLPESIAAAQKKYSDNDKLSFSIGDYTNISTQNRTYDGVYTIETYAHTPDLVAPIQEFSRVLKKGGTLVMLEYSADISKINNRDRKILETVLDSGALPLLFKQTKQGLKSKLENNGFSEIEQFNLTNEVKPTLRKFRILAFIPFHILIVLGKTDRFPNIVSGYYWYKLANNGAFEFILTRAKKM